MVTLIVILITTPRTGLEAAHVQRIEKGLLTAIVIKDRPLPMTLTDRMVYYDVPAVSIAVINNGQLAWAKAYGVREAGGATPVTTETRFQAASISKPVTAMAALALVQQGRLSLDDDVNLSLKSWRVPDNDFTKDHKVTLRRLLNHSAGLNRDEVGSYAAGEALPTLIQALDGQTPAKSAPLRVEATPGSQWRYSGGGYSVIQQLMIDMTGKPFPELLQQLVLRRLGMNDSGFSQPLRNDWEGLAASGHDAQGQPLKGRWHTFPEMAAAGLWTTPSDLARFAIEVQQSFQGKSNRILSTDMTKLMLTKELGAYGLGLWLGGAANVTSFSHAGFNEGFTCILTASLESSQGAVVMTNGDRGSGLFNEILRAIAQEYGWPDYRPLEKTVANIDPALYRSYAGEYNAAGVSPTAISTEAGELYLSAAPLGPQRVKLYPTTEDHFFMLEHTIEVRFVRDNQGNVSELQVQADSQTITAKKAN